MLVLIRRKFFAHQRRFEARNISEGDELYTVGGGFALALADVVEEPLQVVAGFAGEFVAGLADFAKDGIRFHGSGDSRSNRVQIAGHWKPARAQMRSVCRLMAMLWMCA